MKKLLSKALAVVMAAALCVGTCATALAATSSSDTGSITIHGLVEDATASAYQIAYADYDDDGNFLGYKMVTGTESCTFQIGSDGSYNANYLTEENLAALYKALNGASATGTATASDADTDDGNEGYYMATISNLPVGSYLIVITNSESVAYGLMIGSVYYSTEGVTSGVIDDVLDCKLWAKSTTPSMEKTEHHAGDDGTHGESANVGDEITFDIVIKNIPSYQGENPEFYIDDTLTGLTISAEELAALTVKIVDADGGTVKELVEGTDYTVSSVEGHDNEFIVDFVVNGAYTLNDYADRADSYEIVIEYQATVVDDQTYVEGEEQHDNDAVLHYSTTSYVAGNDGTDEDKDYEYDFSMNFTKTDGTSPLAGATFGLYTDETCTTPYTQPDENGDEQSVTCVSGENGTVSFSGLKTGTYYLQETEAPDGYLYNSAIYKIVIEATYKEDGSIDTWTITITNADNETVGSATNSADTNMSISNTKGSELPSTGGIGTTIFYVIGGVLVAGAVVVLVTRRRMNHEV